MSLDDSLITLLIVGDFSPRGRLSKLNKMAPADVLGELHKRIKDVDLAILNLEAPLCQPVRPIIKTGPALYGNPEVASFLSESGFRMACLANNHIMDYGASGLSETKITLDRHGIKWIGAGDNYLIAARPWIEEIRGQTVALLNFAENEWSTTTGSKPGACPIDPVRNLKAIKECKRSADHVIVICHGGHEHYPLPTPRMQELFKFYVDAGAGAVINHHAHCISGYEVYKGAPIFYSIGNFLFDNTSPTDEAWSQGMAVELLLKPDEVGFRIYHYDQCTSEKIFELVDVEEAGKRNDYLQTLNKIIGNDKLLSESLERLVNERQRQYRYYLEPKLSRLLSAAQRRGWFPSIINHRQRALLLNLIRCESHREIMIELLKRDVGNS